MPEATLFLGMSITSARAVFPPYIFVVTHWPPETEMLYVSFLAQEGAFNLSRLSKVVCQSPLSHLHVDVPVCNCVWVSFLSSLNPAALTDKSS